jgi:capsular polysaccharide biosynthesis protein
MSDDLSLGEQATYPMRDPGHISWEWIGPRGSVIVPQGDPLEPPSLEADPELDTIPEPSTSVVPRPAGIHRASVPNQDRLTVLWRAKYVIILATVLVGSGVYFVSNAASPVYSSSATVSVTAASTPGGSAQDVALASNDLASQDAQLVVADGVLTPASKALGVPTATLSAHLTSGTINAQNIVQITVQSSNPASAQRWANGVALAFQSYLEQRGQANSAALKQSVDTQAAPLDQQIAALQQAIASTPPAAPGSAALAEVQSEENQLTEIMGSRATLEQNTALAIASQQPNIDILQSASSPTKISPRPTLYASIAALATLLLASQLAIIAARRRSSAVNRQ